MARMIMVDRNGEENAERDVNTTEDTGDTMRGETGPKNETGSRARMRGSMTDTYDTYNRMENRSRDEGWEVRPIGFARSYGRGSTGSRMSGGRSTGGGYSRGRSSSRRYGLDERTAEEWVYSMRNSDGSRSPMWEMEDVEMLCKKLGKRCDPLELWVAMNAVYSDLGDVFRKYGITERDEDFYMEVACAFWLEDEDAVQDKLSTYYECIVEH